MPVTATQLRTHVSVSATEVADSVLEGYLATATELINDYLTDVPATEPVPPAVVDRALLLVAAEMFTQDQAPNGILNQQYEGEDGATAVPIRISSDPLRPAYALLQRWVPPVIA